MTERMCCSRQGQRVAGRREWLGGKSQVLVGACRLSWEESVVGRGCRPRGKLHLLVGMCCCGEKEPVIEKSGSESAELVVEEGE